MSASREPKKIRWSDAWSEARRLVYEHRSRLALGLLLMLIGRLAVNTAAQAATVVDKIIRYEKMLQEYCGCDALVFVSTYEGFGMPIVEAQAIGRPVITSDLEPMKSVAGGAACYVDPWDPSSIRAGLLQVLTEEYVRNNLIEAGYANATLYKPARIAKQYLALYQLIYGK